MIYSLFRKSIMYSFLFSSLYKIFLTVSGFLCYAFFNILSLFKSLDLLSVHHFRCYSVFHILQTGQIIQLQIFQLQPFVFSSIHNPFFPANSYTFRIPFVKLPVHFFSISSFKNPISIGDIKNITIR